LEAIDEDTVLTATPTVVRKKRSGWFGLSKKPVEQSQHPNQREMPSPLSQADDRKERRPSKVLSKLPPPRALPEEPPQSAQSSEFPIRKKRPDGAKSALSRFWGRIGGDRDGVDPSGRFNSIHSVDKRELIYCSREHDHAERVSRLFLFVVVAGAIERR
jgi:hypothetical protein